MIHALAVFLGGGAGALARYGVGKWTLAWFGAAYPVGTLAVNVAGSLMIGLSVALLDGLSTPARLFFVTGLLGGFTTFSAFSLDALTLIERGQAMQAAGYVLLSVLGSLVACAAGYFLVRT